MEAKTAEWTEDQIWKEEQEARRQEKKNQQEGSDTIRPRRRQFCCQRAASRTQVEGTSSSRADEKRKLSRLLRSKLQTRQPRRRQKLGLLCKWFVCRDGDDTRRRPDVDGTNDDFGQPRRCRTSDGGLEEEEVHVLRFGFCMANSKEHRREPRPIQGIRKGDEIEGGAGHGEARREVRRRVALSNCGSEYVNSSKKDLVGVACRRKAGWRGDDYDRKAHAKGEDFAISPPLPPLSSCSKENEAQVGRTRDF